MNTLSQQRIKVATKSLADASPLIPPYPSSAKRAEVISGVSQSVAMTRLNATLLVLAGIVVGIVVMGGWLGWCVASDKSKDKTVPIFLTKIEIEQDKVNMKKQEKMCVQKIARQFASEK